LLPSSGEGWETPTLLSPLERAHLSPCLQACYLLRAGFLLGLYFIKYTSFQELSILGMDASYVSSISSYSIPIVETNLIIKKLGYVRTAQFRRVRFVMPSVQHKYYFTFIVSKTARPMEKVYGVFHDSLQLL
jgi:hypothetical protein